MINYMSKRHKLTVILSFMIALPLSFIFGYVFHELFFRFQAFGLLMSLSLTFVFFILFMMFLTRKYRRRKKILRRKFPERWDEILSNEVPYYSFLNNIEREEFKKRVMIFLSEKRITGVGTDVDDKCEILVASSAVIPVFKIMDWEYDRLGEILVYPDVFNDDFDFSGSGDTLGMVIPNSSTMIISKPALYEGFKSGKNHANVGIHEFAHKIDEEDGEIDGIPALLLHGISLKEWTQVRDKVIAKIKSRDSGIDPYALKDNAEFFAVVSEMFFDNPEKMLRETPELYSLMKKIFKQDTGSLLKGAVKSMIYSK